MNRAALLAKRAHVQEQRDALAAGEKIVKRLGGATITSTAANVAVQQARLDHLDWLLGATEDEIRASLRATEARIGTDLVDAETVGGLGLDMETMLAKGLAELSQLALGEHRTDRAAAARARATGADGKAVT